MEQIRQSIEAAGAALRTLAELDRVGLSDEDLCDLVRSEEQLARLLAASQVQDAAEVAERSRHELGSAGLSARNGFSKHIPFLALITGVGRRELIERVRVGAAIRPRTSLIGEILPAEFAFVAEGVRSGHVSTGCADAIIGQLRQGALGGASTPDRLMAAEQSLTEFAMEHPVDEVLVAARAWREALDPDGAEPRFEEIRSRRGLVKSREHNGITTWHLRTDPTGTALLDAVLDDASAPGTTPRFLDESDHGAMRSGDGTDTGGAVTEALRDPRSRQQRQLDIVVGVLTAGLRASSSATPDLRATGTVIATITLAELEAGVGVGWLAGVEEPIPASRVRQMMCDARLRIQILGPGSVPLFEAVSNRYFTDAHRRGMLTRDGDRCCGPGCRNPAAWADAHHVDYWSKGGPTSVDNGVLLCGPCHTALHAGQFELRMVDGTPEYRLTVSAFDSAAWRPAGQRHTTDRAA